MWGSFDNKTLVGIAGFVRQTLIETRHRDHVWGVYVRPEHQGKGVATRMMEALITRVKALPGLEIITFTVVSENRPAKALYEKLGFQKYGTYPRSMQV